MDTKAQRNMLDSCTINIDTFINTPIYRIESDEPRKRLRLVVMAINQWN